MLSDKRCIGDIKANSNKISVELPELPPLPPVIPLPEPPIVKPTPEPEPPTPPVVPPVEQDKELIFYNAINPKGEINNILIIGNVNFYPNNEIKIYDRWGNFVFSVKGYNNTDKVFRGISHKGDELANGTYFYIFTYEKEAKQQHKTGWVFIFGEDNYIL